jgi:hypothetical protein
MVDTTPPMPDEPFIIHPLLAFIIIILGTIIFAYIITYETQDDIKQGLLWHQKEGTIGMIFTYLIIVPIFLITSIIDFLAWKDTNKGLGTKIGINISLMIISLLCLILFHLGSKNIYRRMKMEIKN